MEKKIFILLMMALLSNGIIKGQVIDKVRYRITYATKLVTDTTQRDSLGSYIYRDDDMRLDIGNSVSEFYSGRKAAYYDFMKQSLKRTGAIDLGQFKGAKPKISWIVYRNYPQGETSFLESFHMNDYRISEKTITPNWNILTDTCSIFGYHCTRAEIEFKGRLWTAWYTDDIPLDYGPWKLIGLPGLVLRAEDSQKQFIFEASGLEQIDGKEDIILIDGYKKYEPVTQKQFDELNRKSTMADMMFKGSEMVVKTVDKDGHGLTAAETRQKYGKVSPYNPIEIAE